jgi:hypothetical protein
MISASRSNTMVQDHAASHRRLDASGVAIAVLTLLALFIRLWHLGDRSLWFDEGASVQFATMPVGDWLRFLWHGEANMLPYYLLLRGWLHLHLPLGDSEFMVRLPSALFGAATVPVLYALLRRSAGALPGMIAAGLIAFHDFHVSYSQEARSYTMVVFMLCVSWLALARLVEKESRGMRWLYLIAAGLATYGHFFAGLVLISQWISVYCLAPRETVKRLAQLSLITAALVLPAVLYGFAHRGGLNWVPAMSSSGLLYSATVFSGNNAILMGTFALLVAFAIWRAAKTISANGRSLASWNIGAPLCWLLFMPGLLLAVSMIKPMLVARYLLLVLPALAIVAATALAELKPVAASALAVVLSLVLLEATLAGKSIEQPHQDWRNAGRYVATHAAAGDGAVFLPDIGRAPFNWYWQQQPAAMPELVYPGRGPGFTLPSAHRPAESSLEAVRTAPPRRTWFLLTTPDLDPKTPLFRTELASLYPYSCEHQLREVLIVLYAKDAAECPAQ